MERALWRALACPTPSGYAATLRGTSPWRTSIFTHCIGNVIQYPVSDCCWADPEGQAAAASGHPLSQKFFIFSKFSFNLWLPYAQYTLGDYNQVSAGVCLMEILMQRVNWGLHEVGSHSGHRRCFEVVNDPRINLSNKVTRLLIGSAFSASSSQGLFVLNWIRVSFRLSSLYLDKNDIPWVTRCWQLSDCLGITHPMDAVAKQTQTIDSSGSVVSVKKINIHQENTRWQSYFWTRNPLWNSVQRCISAYELWS